MNNNNDRYDEMPYRINAVKLLQSVFSLKGTFYPGIFAEGLNPVSQTNVGGDYNPTNEQMPFFASMQGNTANGTPIRKGDANGRICFMPVWIKTSTQSIEIPMAAISIRGKKTIVSTPLVGRRGTVKELINVSDYEISIKGVLIGKDQFTYPEKEVQQFRDLFELNEAVQLISALSDLTLHTDDKIVIKSIDYPEVGATENAQIISITAETDSQIELIID